MFELLYNFAVFYLAIHFLIYARGDEILVAFYHKIDDRFFELLDNKKLQEKLKPVIEYLKNIDTKIDDLLSFYFFTDREKIEDIEDKNKKSVVKYENKYLEEIRKVENDIIFTEEEKIMKEKIYHKYFEDTLNDMYNRVEIVKKEINDIRNDTDLISEYVTDVGTMNTNKPVRSDSKTTELLILQEELEDLEIQLKNKNKLNEIAEEHANQIVIKQRLENMKNNYVMEHTPLGNVIMFYNAERETFSFYSDNNIPYRFLETVGRKYVLTFRCRPLYIDMDEELKESEKKIKEKELEKKRADDNKKPDAQQKKNVFAKFKTYNKEAGAGRVNVAPGPKNNIPNKNNMPKNENEPVLLKEKANRYTYEGRLCNFVALKKINRKMVDKRYATTFAEFKKMQMSKK
jgi:hypothetical protein